MSIEKVVNYINTKTTQKDKRIYMSILYLSRYILKDTFIKDMKQHGYDVVDINNHMFEILNTRCVFPLKSQKNLSDFIDNKLFELSFLAQENVKYDENIKKMKQHFTTLKIFDALKKENENDINNFITFLDTQEFNIVDIFDIFTQVNTPDKNKNDFFTPLDLAYGVSSLGYQTKVEDIIKNGDNTITIYDPTCGIGNLLFTTYEKIKGDYPDIEVIVFGNDLDPFYSSFALSIFQLFNDKSFFENKNTLTEDVFKGMKFDIIISNPPFGAMNDETYNHLLTHANNKNLTKSQLKLKNKLLKVS